MTDHSVTNTANIDHRANVSGLAARVALLDRLMADCQSVRAAVWCGDATLGTWQPVAKALAERSANRVVACYSAVDALLADKPDFVYVSQPDGWSTVTEAIQGLGFLRDHISGMVVVNQPLTPQNIPQNTPANGSDNAAGNRSENCPENDPAKHAQDHLEDSSEDHSKKNRQNPTVPLSRSDYFSLGYVECPVSFPVSGEGSPATQHYLYSLEHYKTPPTWLNAKYWANPERWNLDDDMAIGP